MIPGAINNLCRFRCGSVSFISGPAHLIFIGILLFIHRKVCLIDLKSCLACWFSDWQLDSLSGQILKVEFFVLFLGVVCLQYL